METSDILVGCENWHIGPEALYISQVRCLSHKLNLSYLLKLFKLKFWLQTLLSTACRPLMRIYCTYVGLLLFYLVLISWNNSLSGVRKFYLSVNTPRLRTSSVTSLINSTYCSSSSLSSETVHVSTGQHTQPNPFLFKVSSFTIWILLLNRIQV
jgi:hypothetical protein